MLRRGPNGTGPNGRAVCWRPEGSFRIRQRSAQLLRTKALWLGAREINFNGLKAL